MADEILDDDNDSTVDRETAEFGLSLSFRVSEKEKDRLNVLLRRERDNRGYMARSTLLKELIGLRNKGVISPADRFYARGIILNPLARDVLNKLGDLAEVFYKLPLEDQEDLSDQVSNLLREARNRRPYNKSGDGGAGTGGASEGTGEIYGDPSPRKAASR